jgi:spermidine synthase
MLQAFVLLLSGFAGLVYEVVWTRWFATVYGGTVPAGAAVLCAYLGGLALGSSWFGRRADRSAAPRRMLGLLQVGVGLLGLASLLIPELLSDFYGALLPAGDSPLLVGLVRFALAALFLLLPAFLMGGALPAAVKWAHAGREESGASLAGWLRGANCLGATLGAALAAALLIPRMGLSGAVLAAVAGNFLAAALAMGRRGTGADSPAGAGSAADFRAVFPGSGTAGRKPDRKRRKQRGEAEAEAGGVLSPSWVWLLAGFVGALTLSTQLAQMRAIAFLTSGTIRSFASVTAVYIMCLGLGSAIGAPIVWWTGRSRALGPLALLLALAGAGTGLSTWLLSVIDPGGSAAFAAILACAPTALPLGAIFPLVVAMLDASKDRVGRATGTAAAALDLGSAAGPLLAALLLLPLVGTRFSLMILGASAALVAVVLCYRAGKKLVAPRRAVRVLIVLGLPAAVLPATYSDIYGSAVSRQIRKEGGLTSRVESVDEGLEAVISVVSVYRPPEGREVKALYIGRRMQADDSTPWLRIEKMIGVLPALLCPLPEGRAFHLGLGSGVSCAWSAAAGSERKVEVAEIVPGVAEKLGEFRPHNSVGKYAVRLGDGRSMLAAEQETFSLIVTDIVFPEDAGAGGLFSVEYFRLVRSKLSAGGLFAHWLPLWQLSPQGFKSATAAFLEVFPEASMWAVSLDGERPLVALVGVNGKSRACFDPQAIAARIKEARLSAKQLAGLNLASPESVLSHFVAGSERLKKLAKGAAPLSDDRPLTELAQLEPGEMPWSLANLIEVGKSWESLKDVPQIGAAHWSEKSRERALELGAVRRALAEANLSLYRDGPGEALVRLRDARERNKLDPEAAYALWSLLWGVADAMLDPGQMAPRRGLYAESLRVWEPLKGKTDFNPRRDFILRGMALAGAALSSGPGGTISSEKGMTEALENAREATALNPREPANWRARAKLAKRLGLKQEAETASKRAEELKQQE